MKFTAKLTAIEFDSRGYLRELDSHMTETVKEAARSWLRTVTVIVPVWSRASRATFTELANAVGFNMPPLVRASGAPDRMLDGLNHSNGGLKITKGKAWLFFYETDLRWLVWNNFNNAVAGDGSGIFSRLRNPTPYRFEVAGKADFESFAKSVKLPNPRKFLKRKKI
jgi:hypothetical protein